MPEQGETRIVVCAQPADLYALRKAVHLAGSADQIEHLHQTFEDLAETAAAFWTCEHRVYAVFEEAAGNSVPSTVTELVARCASATDLPPVAVGIARGRDANMPLGDDWRPSLRSEAVCVAGALADIASVNQVLTEQHFREHPGVASCEFAPASEEAIARAIVALARRIGVAVLCTGDETEVTQIGNFPVLRPHLNAIEFIVGNLATGVLDYARHNVTKCARSPDVDAFENVKRDTYGILEHMDRISDAFGAADLSDEAALREQVAELKRIAAEIAKQLRAGALNRQYDPPTASFDDFLTTFKNFRGTLSTRIRQGDVVREPPFFSDLAVGWS